eukprot:231962-Lingulodinium_polyedra.AAC.1
MSWLSRRPSSGRHWGRSESGARCPGASAFGTTGRRAAPSQTSSRYAWGRRYKEVVTMARVSTPTIPGAAVQHPVRRGGRPLGPLGAAE